MLVINAVYRFGYCRTLCPLALYLALYLPLPARPPPDGSVFIAARRDARLNPRRSIYLFPATGIDPIDRQQPAVFIFIGTADSTEKKERKKKKTRETATTTDISRQCTSRVLVLEIPNSPAIMHISDLCK